MMNAQFRQSFISNNQLKSAETKQKKQDREYTNKKVIIKDDPVHDHGQETVIVVYVLGVQGGNNLCGFRLRIGHRYGSILL